MPTAEYRREWRARHGARTGQPGRPPTAPCPSAACWKRHRRRGEHCTDECHQAYLDEQRMQYERRRTRGS